MRESAKYLELLAPNFVAAIVGVDFQWKVMGYPESETQVSTALTRLPRCLACVSLETPRATHQKVVYCEVTIIC